MLNAAVSCSGKSRRKGTSLRVKIEEYNIPIREIVKIKKGEDLILQDGRIIPNAELTTPPPKPRSYAYCSDTRPNPEVLPLIRGTNLLFHETTFLHRDEKLAHQTWHSTSKQAADIASRAGVGKLLIGHFSSRYKDLSEFESEAREVFGETFSVNDGDVFRVD